MHKHLEKMGEVTFDKIFGQKLGECFGLVEWAGRMCIENCYGIK